MKCGIICPREDCPKDCPHLVEAERLQDLTDGAVDVAFSPNTFMEGDREAEGHLYHGWLSSEEEEGFLLLDDRNPEPMEVQIVAELRRVADFCHNLANDTAARCGEEVTNSV